MSNEGLHDPQFEWGKGFPGASETPKKASSKRGRRPTAGPVLPPTVSPEEAISGLRRMLRDDPDRARELREALNPPPVPPGGGSS